LWQYAARWASSHAWNQAKRAASETAAAGTRHPGEIEPGAVVMAVVCETKRLFDAVADGMTTQRRVEGDRFAVCTGKLAGRPVVVARPLSGSPSCTQLITAVVDGHRPQFVLSAAEAASCSAEVMPGSVVVANRICNAAGHSMRLEGVAPATPGFYTGSIATRHASQPTIIVDPSQAPLAEDRWSEPIARACQQVGVPMIAASVVFEPVAGHRSQESESLKRQKSLAGRAGVLTGMLWKKRSGLRDVWNEKEASWAACSRLAQLAEQLANAMQT
jgi:hypothetical protein